MLTWEKYLTFDLDGLENRLIPLFMDYQGLQTILEDGFAIRSCQPKMATKMAAKISNL